MLISNTCSLLAAHQTFPHFTAPTLPVPLQASLLLRGAVAAFNGVQVDAAAPSWRRHAAATQAYNSAFELSAAAMRLGLVQLQVLRVAGQLVRGGHLGDQVNGTDIREMQEAVCEEVSK